MAKCIESYNQEEDERNGECVSNLDLSLSQVCSSSVPESIRTSHQVIGLTLVGRTQSFPIHLCQKLIKITFSFLPLFLILISDSMEHILNELEDLFQSLVRRMNKSEMEDFELVIIIF